jgi:membrane-bound ClpP family serine protease
MPTATLTPDLRRGAARRASAEAVVLLGALALAALTPALAAAQSSDRGYVLKVPSGLNTGWIDTQKKLINNRLDRFETERSQNRRDPGARFKLVCDFNPDGQPSACDNFYAADYLADYLLELRNRHVQTVAYVHDETTRHSVLPVLACNEIVMADRVLGTPTQPRYAALGRVATPEVPLTDKMRAAYEKIAAGRASAAVVRKMYDADLAVVKTRDGRYLDQKSAPDGEPVAELGRNEVALVKAGDNLGYGLCTKKLNSLNEVLANYGLSAAGSLYDAPEQTVAWRVVLSGELNGGLREKAERRISRAAGMKANLLILQLECHGGDGDAARQLAQFLLDLNKKRGEPVHTVAYVTRNAADTAAFLAFACDEMVFEDGAALGFEQYVKLQKDPRAEGTLREGLVQVAKQGVYSPVLAEGMLSRELRIHLVVSRSGDGRRQFLSDADYLQDQASDQPQWESKSEVVKPVRKEDQERYLTLSADPNRPGADPRKLGLVAPDGVVRGYEDLCDKYGLSPAEVETADSDWLDMISDFLRNPWTSVVLVMVGITCLILELKMPGVSLPGVIAAICFVLFFWAHSGFNQIGILAMLLFALGLLLVALELFVLPGFGVPGISGILLMLASLGLVAYGHWPRSNGEWLGFGKALSPFTFSLLGAVVSAYLLAKYLPHVPYANRLFLKPPSTDPDDASAPPVDPIRAELAALLGAIGVAATPLRPAGKVQFGDQFVDVVSESGYVQPGTRVQVVEIEGVRVVVKEV